MAGEPGFEPGNGGIKTRCLTTWRLPNAETVLSGAHYTRVVLECIQNSPNPKRAARAGKMGRG